MEKSTIDKIIKSYNKLADSLGIIGGNLLDMRLEYYNNKGWDVFFLIESEYNNPHILYEGILDTCDKMSSFIDLRGPDLGITIQYKHSIHKAIPSNMEFFTYFEIIEVLEKNSYGFNRWFHNHPKYGEYRNWRYRREVEVASELRNRLIERDLIKAKRHLGGGSKWMSSIKDYLTIPNHKY